MKFQGIYPPAVTPYAPDGSIGMVDEQGDLTLGSDQFEPTNLADREWFKVHQLQNRDVVFLGKPLLGRVTGKWAFQMSRRIDKPDARRVACRDRRSERKCHRQYRDALRVLVDAIAGE